MSTAHTTRRRTPEQKAARAERAEALRAALGLRAIEAYQAVRALAGERVNTPPVRGDYNVASRWFTAAPPNELLVYLEMRARAAGVAIAREGEP